MKMTPLWEAIIWAIHQEPDYKFVGSEKKAAERMRKLGYLKRVPDANGHFQHYPLGCYWPCFLINRYKVTAKGERAFKEYRRN